MLRRVFLGVVVLLAGLAAPAVGQEVQLKFKFKEGDSFWVEDVTTNKQNLSVPGFPAMQSESKTTMVTKYTVTKATPESVDMTMKIENVEVKSDGGVAEQIAKILEKTKNSTFNLTMTPNGKVIKFEGFADVAKKLTQGDDNMANALKEIFTEDMFTQGVAQVFGFAPDGAVKSGDTWKRETKYPGGPLGDFKSSNIFTYKGKSASGEEIAVKQTLEYMPGKGSILGGMAKVVKGDLKADQASGTYFFDADKGRLISATSKMHISGSLTLDVAGQQTAVEMTMDSSVATKVHDKSPSKQ